MKLPAPLAYALCVFAAACSPRDPSPAVEPGSGPAAQAPANAPLPVPDSASIAGAWDVASFEGYVPKRLSGTARAAFADFGDDGVRLRIECNDSGRAGRVADGRFVLARNSTSMQTVMGCGAERNARESRFFAFFEKNPTIEIIAPDRLRLRAEGRELILERPALRRLRFVPTASEIQGRWRMVEITRNLPGGGHAGSGLTEVPGRIVFSGDKLFYNRCPEHGLTFRFDRDATLEKTGGAEMRAGPTGCAELNASAPGRDIPAPLDALRLLHAGPAVEKTDENSLLLSTDEIGLLITRAPCGSLEQSDDHRTTRVRDCASPE